MKLEKKRTRPLHGPDSSGTLLVQERQVDPTTRKMLTRMDELESQISQLQKERGNIVATLASIGYRPPDARLNLLTSTESKYAYQKPFRSVSLTEACLTVLRDQAKAAESHDQWLDKTQIEYLVVRGGYKFEAEDSINSVHVTLRRLWNDGLIQASKGKGSRSSKYHFLKDREDDINSRATK